MGPNLLPEKLTAGLLDSELLIVREKLWFAHDRSPAHYGKGVSQWVNTTYPGR
jgi:hypothetical protein